MATAPSSPSCIPIGRNSMTTTHRPQHPASARMEVEVYDYWYRQPKAKQRKRGAAPTRASRWRRGTPSSSATCASRTSRTPSTTARSPYVPLFNTFIPGVPSGRPELFDIEQPDPREGRAHERGRADAGQDHRRPVLAVGRTRGSRRGAAGRDAQAQQGGRPRCGQSGREPSSPWMPEFQLEQYLARLDREMADVSGLNDLLRGLAPATVLSSSARPSPRWWPTTRPASASSATCSTSGAREVWDLAAHVWGRKNTGHRAGAGRRRPAAADRPVADPARRHGDGGHGQPTSSTASCGR